MENCLFCKIMKGEIPSAKVYENEYVYAFRDINPQAPTHVLVIPKEHVASLNDTACIPDRNLAECLRAIPVIAAQEGLTGHFQLRTRRMSDRSSSPFSYSRRNPAGRTYGLIL